MYSALTCARLGLRTAVALGVDRGAARAAEIGVLRDAGALIEQLDLASGPVFENVETARGRVQTCVQESVPLPVPSLPVGWLAAPAWILTPVADELGDEWATLPSSDAIVALGWQGMLRNLTPGRRVGRRMPRRSALLERADLVGVSHHDIEPDVRVEDLLALLKQGALLLLTKGAGGGILWRRGEGGVPHGRRYPAIAPPRTVDPTGAGDTFLAALVATRLMPDFGRARHRGGDLRFASAAGSLAVEKVGLEGVPDLAAVIARTRSSFGRR
jgi:hypothetical protein